MATYSVWDWNENSFRVYRDAKPTSIGDDPTPPRPRAVSPIGAVPDKDVMLLPPAAKFVGMSAMAVGEIAIDPLLRNQTASSSGRGGSGDGLGAFGDQWTSLGPVLVVGAAIAAVMYFSRRA